jgi:hypothetical protein
MAHQHQSHTRWLRDWRLSSTVSFLLLTAAALSLRYITHPVGPGTSIYHDFFPFWVLIAAAFATLIVSVRIVRVPWPVVITFGMLAGATVVSLSMIWGVPFGPYDAWAHLWRAKSGFFSPEQIVYPLFHIWLATGSLVFDIDIEPILQRVVVISVAVGVLFLTIVARQVPSPVSRGGRMTTVIIGIPALFLGFVPRPFTVSFPFILLSFWFAFYILNGTQLSQTRQWALLGFFASLVVLHPFTEFVILIVLVGAYLTIYGEKLAPRLTEDRSIHRKSPFRFMTLVVLGLVFATYIFITTSVGVTVAGSSLLLLLGDVSASGGLSGSVTGGTSMIAKAFSSSSNFLELVTRITYAGLLVGVVIVSFASTLWKSERRQPLRIVFVSGGIAFGVIVMVTVFSSQGVGIARLFVLSPLIAVPGTVYAFSQSNRGWHAAVIIAIALIIVVAGLGTAFSSSIAGGYVSTSNSQTQSAGAWAVEYVPNQLIGSDKTIFVIRGAFGDAASGRLTPRGGTGVWYVAQRDAPYAWMVPTGPDEDYATSEATVVVDYAARVRARQLASEGQPQGLRCLKRFKQQQSKIFANDDTYMYKLATERQSQCIGA